MKMAASIFMCIMLSMTALPLSAVCTDDEQCCSDGCCKEEPVKKDTKQTKDCNPFMTCPLCSLFLTAKISILPDVTIQDKSVFFVKNDNRIIQNLSECWHPPNMGI